ncbi:hypothetical protein HY634_03605 [Candidatus Uhrbacteria bacterium]|nr:hypothetical protein [Candidatus Uhrbacteria bacterium]
MPERFPSSRQGANDEIINRLGLSADELRLAKEVHVQNMERLLELLRERAVALTPAQHGLSSAVAVELDTTLRAHGIDMPIRPAPDVVAFEQTDFLESTGMTETAQQRTGGIFIPAKNTIVLRYLKKAWSKDARNETFVHTLAHESVHAMGIRRMQTILTPEGDAAIEAHRSGLHIFALDNPERSRFSDLDEAVTEMLAITVSNRIIRARPEQFRTAMVGQIAHYLRHASDDAPWRKLAMKMGWRPTDSDERTTVLAGRLLDEKKFPYSVGRERFRSYARQRRVLKKVMDEIRRRNSGDYGTPGDVEALFYRAMIGGTMLELGRVVEKTFGAGTFRLMAKDYFGSDLRERLESNRS